MILQSYTVPKTNSSHLKMDDWKMSFFPFGALRPIFRGELLVSGSVSTCVRFCDLTANSPPKKIRYTLPKFNGSSLKIHLPKRKVVFQGRAVKLRACNLDKAWVPGISAISKVQPKTPVGVLAFPAELVSIKPSHRKPARSWISVFFSNGC